MKQIISSITQIEKYYRSPIYFILYALRGSIISIIFVIVVIGISMYLNPDLIIEIFSNS